MSLTGITTTTPWILRSDDDNSHNNTTIHKDDNSSPTPSTACDVDSFILTSLEEELPTSESPSPTESLSDDNRDKDTGHNHHNNNNSNKVCSSNSSANNRPRTLTDTTASTTASGVEGSIAADPVVIVTAVAAADNDVAVPTSTKNRPSPPLKKKKKKLWKRLCASLTKIQNNKGSMNDAAAAAALDDDLTNLTTTNPLMWLEVVCPDEVVSKVVCFLAPQTTQALLQTNAYWFELLRAANQGTWRVLCEGLYKWQEGRDEVPTTSWKEHYRLHPCVPIDYRTIPSAMAVATQDYDDHHTIHTKHKKKSKKKLGVAALFTGRSSATNGGGHSQYHQTNKSSSSDQTQHQHRSVHVLLRPGTHILEESLVILATSENAQVTLSTMELPHNRFYSARRAYAEQQQAQSCPGNLAVGSPTRTRSRSNSQSSPRRASLRHLVSGCRSVHGVVDSTDQPMELDDDNIDNGDGDDDAMDVDGLEFYQANMAHTTMQSVSERGMRPATPPLQQTTMSSPTYAVAASSVVPPQPLLMYPTRARLVLRTRRNNEPILRIRQGHLNLLRVDLDHASQGADIWGGNAAVQIQPFQATNGLPIRVDPEGNALIRPSACLEQVAVSSQSGRGVVCLDGGHVVVRDSMIFDCAATGLYVGGPGSEADMRRSDVIRNGIGSRLPPPWRASGGRFVSAGHSGVYLEQGKATIQECNISSNNLTGISAVSHDNAALVLRNSDLVANGQVNIERPPPGTPSFRLSDISNTNHIAAVGRPCLRSNLEVSFRPTFNA